MFLLNDALWLAVKNLMKTGGKSGAIPDLWDGKAAQRIVKIISSWTFP